MKSDFFRFGKSKLLYCITMFSCLLAFALTMLIRQDIRLGISVFGNIAAFKGVRDIVKIGVQFQKGLGILIAVFISICIGQEYLWKAWQHKWIIGKNRTYIYLSKTILSSVVSAVIFLLFEIMVLFCSEQIQTVLSNKYFAMIICCLFVYTALGVVMCMLSMLIRNSTASVIICLTYVLFSETFFSVIKNISSLSHITANAGDWLISHQ